MKMSKSSEAQIAFILRQRLAAAYADFVVGHAAGGAEPARGFVGADAAR